MLFRSASSPCPPTPRPHPPPTPPPPTHSHPPPKAYHVSYRYYHTLFTHSLPKALRTIADETPTCVDVLMNFLVATVTKLPPIKVPYGRQHPEAVPMVRRLQGLDHTRKALMGKEKRAEPLHSLIQILLQQLEGSEKNQPHGHVSLSPLRILGIHDQCRSLSPWIRTASTV